MPAIPLIIMGVQAGVSAYQAHKQGRVADKAQQTYDTTSQAIQKQAGKQSGIGESLLSGFAPQMQQAASYYGTLLKGNRAAMTEAVAPAIGSISDTYRGASRALDASNLRGAQKDVATGDLARQRAGSISSLFTGVQPMAADALSKIGGQGLAIGGNILSGAGALYGSLLDPSMKNAVYQNQNAMLAGQAAGSSVMDFAKTWNDMNKNRNSPYGRGGGVSGLPGGSSGPF